MGKPSSVAIPLDFNFGLRTYAGLFDINLERGESLPAEVINNIFNKRLIVSCIFKASKVYTTVRG
jgi:hypothetical protein